MSKLWTILFFSFITSYFAQENYRFSRLGGEQQYYVGVLIPLSSRLFTYLMYLNTQFIVGFLSLSLLVFENNIINKT